MNTRVSMNNCLTTSLMVLLVLAGCTAANAQEKGRTGVTMGYPASVGIISHVTDGVALRPEFSFSKGSNDFSTSSPTLTSNSVSGDGWTLGVGLSALFYVGKWDSLRSYISPRLTYARSTNNQMSSAPSSGLLGSPSPQTNSSSGSTDSVSGFGSFGAEYSVSPKFSVFGEVGGGYSRSTTRGSNSSLYSSTSTSTSRVWGTRSAAGVAFYF